jgi:predicted GIY-YIG superfamily endonuclease
MEGERGTVYLIHFDANYAHARHYLGWAKSLNKRLDHHRAGRGARLMAAVSRSGISWRVVRTWEDQDRAFERKLHRRKETPRLCPVCRAERRR